MNRVMLLLLGGCMAFSLTASPAMALGPFKKLFDAKYVKDSGDEAFQAAFKKASCNVCHVKGESKDVRNAYGEALAKHIEGDADKRLDEASDKGGREAKSAEQEKINAEFMKALDIVAKEKSPSGKTWGEILAAKELPVK